MLIVVTGSSGAGKSTVCQKIADGARKTDHPCGGVLSHKTPSGHIVVEDVRTGRRMDLAGPPGLYSGPGVGPFSFSPSGIAFATNAIDEGIELPLTLIDEIGPLELSGSGFVNAVPLLRQRCEGDQIVVIREELLNSFIPLFGRESLVLKVSLQNRDLLPSQIERLLSTRREPG